MGLLLVAGCHCPFYTYKCRAAAEGTQPFPS